MAATIESATGRVRFAGLLLIAGLVSGPLGTHVYWLLGGTWGLYTNGVRDEAARTGVRIVAAFVILLLVAAILVVLARVGLWRQTLVSDRVIAFFTWALAAVFLLETLAAFTWSRDEWGWWLYGPVSLVIAALALVVARAGGSERGGSAMSAQFTGKYVSLTTFRRDGTPVPTPVWFVAENGHLLVETDGDSYKVKRIRRNDRVEVAACNAMGRVAGEVVAARAEILPDDELPRVEQLLHRKYRLDYIFVLPIYLLVQRLRGRPLRYEKPVILSITPT